MQQLDGRVAVVTGGASGIGLALARRFAAEGMCVVIGDVEEPALDTAVSELRATGATVEGVWTDVADAASVQHLADVAVERFGAIHVACNNAGVAAGGLSWEVDLHDWQWVLGVNLWGVVHGVRAFVPVMVDQGEGHVVNTASIAGLTTVPLMGPYTVSKHAVVALSETLHHELALTAPHVGVSVLCPGWVRTNIADSARNRPGGAPAADVAAPAAGVMRGFIEQGMAPDAVAGQVLDAIREQRFWILTHDAESERWSEAVNRRLRTIESRTNPRFDLPT